MGSVLLVCTANLDRSPLACARLRQMVTKRDDLGKWRIESAGTWAVEGKSAPPEILAVGLELGLDLSTHLSRSVTSDLLRSFNLVLTMEKGHKEAMQIEFHDIARRIYLLSEMSDLQVNILNPAHRSLNECRQLAKEIDDWLLRGYDKIVRLASL